MPRDKSFGMAFNKPFLSCVRKLITRGANTPSTCISWQKQFSRSYRSVLPYQCVNIIASTHSDLIREFYFRKIKLEINKEYYLFDKKYLIKSLLYITGNIFI